MPVSPKLMALRPSWPSFGLLPLISAASLLAVAPAAAWQEQEVDDPDPPEDLGGELALASEELPIHGLLWARTRSRWSSDQEDHDLFTTLRLDIGDTELNGFSAHIAAVGLADLDGTTNGEYDFYGVYDTYSSSVQLRLNLAYVDLPQEGLVDVLRAGRQQLYTTPEFVWFDGLRAEHGDRTQQEPMLGAFVGVPVRQFRASSGGDMLSGVYGELTPWYQGRLRLDYMRFEDESVVGLGANDLLSVELGQRLMPGVEVEGSYSRLDDEDRDMEFALTSYGLVDDLVARVSWYELLEPQGTLANELDPFSSTTISLEPYRQGRVLVSKGIGEELVLEGGADFRRVSESFSIGQFNRDFERYFLRSTWLDAFDSGFDATLTGEIWDADASDVETWGFDLERELSDDTELSLGSYYSLYKYDPILNAERIDVRSYHAELSYDWREDVRVNVDYIYEDDDLDDQHTIRLGVRWSF